MINTQNGSTNRLQALTQICCMVIVSRPLVISMDGARNYSGGDNSRIFVLSMVR
jgi:hypothetical protein